MAEARKPLPLKTMMPMEQIARETGLVTESDAESGALRAEVPATRIEIESAGGSVRLGRLVGLGTGLTIIGFFALAFWLFIGRTEGAANEIFGWFPPWFSGFNAFLLIAATSIPAAVTLSYVFTMKAEKTNRLFLQFKSLTEFERAAVKVIISDMFRVDRYLGAMAAPTIVTFLGAVALLFFKPVFDPALKGIDFSMGANLLLVGPAVEFIGAEGNEGLREVVYMSVVAFTFGFLGAWLYFVSELTRSFFSCDLRPRTLIAGAIRMTTASLTALVVGLTLQAGFSDYELPNITGFFSWVGSLPDLITGAEQTEVEVGTSETNAKIVDLIVPIAFIIGFFPDRGMGFLNALSGWISRVLAPEARNLTPLGKLPGMSYSHSQRLRMEGIDGIENLAGHHPILLTLQTGFTYQVVEGWVGEAWLRRILGTEAHAKLAERTGLRGKYELRRIAWRLARAGNPKANEGDAAQALEDLLTTAMGEDDRMRMRTIAHLCLYFQSWSGDDPEVV